MASQQGLQLIIHLKKSLRLLGVLISLLLILLWSMFGALSFIDFLDHTMNSFLYVIPIVGVIIFFLFLFLMIKKEKLLQSLWAGVLILYLSLAIAIFLAIIFSESTHWYLKYSIGIFIGIIAYFKKSSYWEMSLITFLSVLICDEAEYLIKLDPPDTFNFISTYNHTYGNTLQEIWLILIIASAIFTAKLLAMNNKKTAADLTDKIDKN